MALLGTVILSFAFHLFDRRELIRRHWIEIMATAVVSALFSMYTTAFAGRALGERKRGRQAVRRSIIR